MSGLRERKKARTKTAIQQEALRLFREQGYAATTIEQIADAAEVAPSTVFRYFATKEDLADLTDYFPLLANLIEAFDAQPSDLGPIPALRRSIRAVFASQSPAEHAARRERELLMLAVPELWAANLSSIPHAIRVVSELVARRTGRSSDDAVVRNLSRAVCGVALAALFDTAQSPDADVPAELDEALAHLEAGLPL